MLQFIDSINDILWSYVIIALLIGCALYFTIRTKGFQFRMLGEMCRVMAGRDAQQHKDSGDRKLGTFQAFAVSLASRVGTGNLAGVASAIFVGGPGAVFWMWMMALLGSATGFVEATLAQLYKRKGNDAFYGGPAYYMETGLGQRWMGVIFSILMILTFGFANNVLQSNVILGSLNTTFGWSKLPVAIIMMVGIMAIIIGGIKRISLVTSYMVPFMAVAYLILAIVIILLNITKIPDVLRLIIDSAFGLRQVGGGVVGLAVMQGIKRGLFSNEAGEGSAPNAAAIADTSHPAKQGLVQALGVFVDTLVICSCTAMIVIISGQYDSGKDGIELTIAALNSLIGPVGVYFITAAVFLFAFTSILGNYFYGENSLRFVTGNDSRKARVWLWVYRAIIALTIVGGAFGSLQDVWVWIDICMGLLTICNLIAIVQLSKHAFFLLDNYKKQRKEGKEPQFHRSMMPQIEKDLEAWD